MASITIRRLPTTTKERLRVRAARSGLSLEAYSRQILNTASLAEQSVCSNIADLAISCFGKDHGIDLKLPPRGNNRPLISFE